MTLPASGPISFADINQEIYGSASTTQVSLGDAVVRTIFQDAGGEIDMNKGYNKTYVIAGNSGVIQGGSSYTLPRTSGTKINVLAIGGGGGGGGGSGRTNWSGFSVGAGGGGSGGAAYATNVTVTPGQSVTFTIGGGAGGGAANAGNYGGGSNGGTGGTTTIYVNGNPVAQATGGGGTTQAYQFYPAVLAQYGAGPGGASIGSNALSGTAGLDGQQSVYVESGGRGGAGGRGYTINTGATSIGSIIGYGSYGSEGENQPGGTGTTYGGGGTGGGTVQSDRHYAVRQNPGGGSTGAVFIWWFPDTPT
jgi:hypothetical protein